MSNAHVYPQIGADHVSDIHCSSLSKLCNIQRARTHRKQCSYPAEKLNIGILIRMLRMQLPQIKHENMSISIDQDHHSLTPSSLPPLHRAAEEYLSSCVSLLRCPLFWLSLTSARQDLINLPEVNTNKDTSI